MYTSVAQRKTGEETSTGYVPVTSRSTPQKVVTSAVPVATLPAKPIVVPSYEAPKKSFLQHLGDSISEGLLSLKQSIKTNFGIGSPVFGLNVDNSIAPNNLTPEQQKNAEKYVSTKQQTPLNLPISQATMLFNMYTQQQWEKEHPEWVAKYGKTESSVTPELAKEAFNSLQNSVLGITGGEDIVLKQLGENLSNTTLKEIASQSNPERISSDLQTLFKIQKSAADEISIPLSKAKTIDEVKNVLSGTHIPESPVNVTARDITNQNQLPFPKIQKAETATSVDDVLIQEARKYKSADEFVKAVNRGETINIPLSKIGGLEPQPAPFPTTKRTITEPVEIVLTDQGNFMLEAGNHRYHQAVFNGDTTIPAKIRLEPNAKTQLIDLYNKAVKNTAQGVENAVARAKAGEDFGMRPERANYIPVAQRSASQQILAKAERDAAHLGTETKPALPGVDLNRSTPITPDEAAPIAKVAADKYWDEVIAPAREKGKATVIGGDDLKDYFGNDYNDNNHAIYSKAAFSLYERALKENPNDTVVFTGGGPASGKTDIITKGLIGEGFDGIIYDSNMASYDGAARQIQMARDAGKKVELHGVIPDLDKARTFSLLREAETGRGIKDTTFARNHAGFPNTVIKLLEDGKINPDEVFIYDTRNVNTFDKAFDMVKKQDYMKDPLAGLKKLGYTEEQLLKDYAKKNYDITTGTRQSPLRTSGGSREAPPQNRANKGNAVRRRNASVLEKNLVKKERGIAKSKIQLPPKLGAQQRNIEGLSETIAQMKERLAEHPGKELQRFISKKEGEFLDFKNPSKAATEAEKQAIIERNRKIMNLAKNKFAGTEFSDMFDDPDIIRASIEQYQEGRDMLKTLEGQRRDLKRAFYEARKNFYTEELDRYAMNNIVARQERLKTLEEVEKILRKEGRDRKAKVDAIQDFFNLTDKEMKSLFKGNPDFRLMSDKEFENYLKAVQGKAYELSAHREAIMQIENTIHELELLKVDNLREAMKLKKLENMSQGELEKFDDLLRTFKKGDEFLGKRQLETVRFTDMEGIKTHREAREFLAKEAGVPIEELQKVHVGTTDKFLYDNALARRNPLYKVMVDNTTAAEVEAGGRFIKIKKEVEKLITAARASRKRSLIDRAIPTDKLIFDYLENTADMKKEIVKQMTPEEYKAAIYIQNKYAEVRDYMVEQETLKKFRTNYITHIRRSFLEAWKDSSKNLSLWKGFKQAATELFDNYKQDSAVFNILDQKTGDVLPLEKFFKFSMARKGNLVPTQNVSKAFLEYMRVFEQKRQLDSFIPKLDIFAHVLAPRQMTKRGLEFDDSIKRFVKTWINSKKGRSMDVGIIKQGDKLDWALRTGIAFTRLLDLGLNIPVGLASNVGEQAFNFIELGPKKYATGLARFATSKGKKIVSQYEEVVGEKFLDRMRDTSKTIGEKLGEGIYGLFSTANRRANAIHLLADMTPEEWQAGKISLQKLTEVRKNIAKYHVVGGTESIVGKTAPGMMFKQYRTWAVPAFHTTLDNLKKIGEMAKSKDFKGVFKSKEAAELFRGTIVTATLLLTSYGLYESLQNKKDRNFMENVAFKSMNDALSFIGALDPSFWSTPARLQKFVADLGYSISNIATSLVNGKRTKKGTIAGLDKLKAILTPTLVRHLFPDDGSDETVSTTKKTGQIKAPPGLPELPSPKKLLPTPPGLPKLPGIK